MAEGTVELAVVVICEADDGGLLGLVEKKGVDHTFDLVFDEEGVEFALAFAREHYKVS